MTNDFRGAKLLLTNEPLLAKIYGLWAIGALFVLGVFGVGPLIHTLTAKVDIYKELTGSNAQINLKLQEVYKASDQVAQAAQYLPVLYQNVPDNLNTQSYFLIFTEAASSAGFAVNSFSPSYAVDGAAPDSFLTINAALEGTGDVSSLVTALESSQRLTVLDKLTFSNNLSGKNIRLELRILNYN